MVALLLLAVLRSDTTIYLGCHSPSIIPPGATCVEGRPVGAVNAAGSGAWVVRDRAGVEKSVARRVHWKREMLVIASAGNMMTYVDELPDLRVNRVLYTRDTVTVVFGADSVARRPPGHSRWEGIVVPVATAIPKSDAVIVFQYLQGRP